MARRVDGAQGHGPDVSPQRADLAHVAHGAAVLCHAHPMIGLTSRAGITVGSGLDGCGSSCAQIPGLH